MTGLAPLAQLQRTPQAQTGDSALANKLSLPCG
jgi:hypothetical protein